MALYPYTMQPIPLDLTEAEFHQAQFELFEQSTPPSTLKGVKPKEWFILGAVVIAAIAGLLLVEGYSTILFWVMLALVVIYLLVRTLGMRWYIKREFEKQINEQEIPEEMEDLKLGVQKHGLIIAMPAPSADMLPKAQRGMQMRTSSMQSATIPWNSVTSWEETDDYIFVMFEINSQKSSQIIPKRLQERRFPIDSVRKHLQEVVPIRGIRPDSLS